MMFGLIRGCVQIPDENIGQFLSTEKILTVNTDSLKNTEKVNLNMELNFSGIENLNFGDIPRKSNRRIEHP